ncbi:uncharacterized protein LOC117338668 [Pecten maximus]|uniref:uncharacterized protein LOC117338668 n=1 Tax=Pecten maximus TaxID=6579 RepID=UPI001458F73B|nr:uncharacterized protein LOC117338668 [Pecten maximus]
MSPCEIIDRIYEGTVACFFHDGSSGEYGFTTMYRKPEDTGGHTGEDVNSCSSSDTSQRSKETASGVNMGSSIEKGKRKSSEEKLSKATNSDVDSDSDFHDISDYAYECKAKLVDPSNTEITGPVRGEARDESVKDQCSTNTTGQTIQTGVQTLSHDVTSKDVPHNVKKDLRQSLPTEAKIVCRKSQVEMIDDSKIKADSVKGSNSRDLSEPNASCKTKMVESADSESDNISCLDLGGDREKQQRKSQELADDPVNKTESKKSAHEKHSSKKICSETTKLSMVPSESDSTSVNSPNCGTKVQAFVYDGSSSDDFLSQNVLNKTVTGKKTDSPETKFKSETIKVGFSDSDISCLDLGGNSQKLCESQELVTKDSLADDSVKNTDQRKSAQGKIATKKLKSVKTKLFMAPAASRSDSSGDNSSKSGTKVQAFVYDGSSSDDFPSCKTVTGKKTAPPETRADSKTVKVGISDSESDNISCLDLGGDSQKEYKSQELVKKDSPVKVDPVKNTDPRKSSNEQLIPSKTMKSGKTKLFMALTAPRSDSSGDNSSKSATKVQAFVYDGFSSVDFMSQNVLNKAKTGKQTNSCETRANCKIVKVGLSDSDADNIPCLDLGGRSPKTQGLDEGGLTNNPVRKTDNKKSAQGKVSAKKIKSEKSKLFMVPISSTSDSSSANSSKSGTRVQAFVYDGSSSDDFPSQNVLNKSLTGKKTDSSEIKANIPKVKKVGLSDFECNDIACLDLDGDSHKMLKTQAFVCEDSSSDEALQQEVASKSVKEKKESLSAELASDAWDDDISCIDLVDDTGEKLCKTQGMADGGSSCGNNVSVRVAKDTKLLKHKGKAESDHDSDIGCIHIEGGISKTGTGHVTSPKTSIQQKGSAEAGDRVHPVEDRMLDQSQLTHTDGKRSTTSKSEDTAQSPPNGSENLTRKSVSSNVEKTQGAGKKKEMSFLGSIKKTLKKGDVRRKQKDGQPMTTTMASTSRKKTKKSKTKNVDRSSVNSSEHLGKNTKVKSSWFPVLGSVQNCNMSFPNLIDGNSRMLSLPGLEVVDAETTDRNEEMLSEATTSPKDAKSTKDERSSDRFEPVPMTIPTFRPSKEIPSDTASDLSCIDLEDTVVKTVTVVSKLTPTKQSAEHKKDVIHDSFVIKRQSLIATIAPAESRASPPVETRMMEPVNKTSPGAKSDTDSDLSCLDLEKTEIKSVQSKPTTKQKHGKTTKPSCSTMRKGVGTTIPERKVVTRSSTAGTGMMEPVNKMSPGAKSDTDSDLSCLDLEKTEIKSVEFKSTPTQQKHGQTTNPLCSTTKKGGAATTTLPRSKECRWSPPDEKVGNTPMLGTTVAFSSGTISNPDSDISCIDLGESNAAVKTMLSGETSPSSATTIRKTDCTKMSPNVQRVLHKTKSRCNLGSSRGSLSNADSDDLEELATTTATKSTVQMETIGNKPLQNQQEANTSNAKINLFTASSFLPGGGRTSPTTKLSTRSSNRNYSDSDSDLSDNSKMSLTTNPHVKKTPGKLKKAATKFLSNIKTKLKRAKTKADQSDVTNEPCPMSADCRRSPPAETMIHTPMAGPSTVSDTESDLSCIDLDTSNNNVNCYSQGCLSKELKEFLYSRKLSYYKSSLAHPGTLTEIKDKVNLFSLPRLESNLSCLAALGLDTDLVPTHQRNRS